MTYTITHNSQFNSYEIYFDGKPSEAVRNALKELKFRWHGVKRCWYGFGQSEESLAAVITGTTTENEPATVVGDGYLGGGSIYGSKSSHHLHGADLSAAIRADLKNAGIKGTSVKIHTYTGGQNLTVTVRLSPDEYIPFDQYLAKYDIPCFGWIYFGDGADGFIHADKYWAADSDERAKIRLAAAEYQYRKVTTKKQTTGIHWIDYLTPEALAKVQKIDELIAAYRYDCSNGMVDYFHTNFYYDICLKPTS